MREPPFMSAGAICDIMKSKHLSSHSCGETIQRRTGGFNMSGTDSKAGGRDYLLLFTQAKSISEPL